MNPSKRRDAKRTNTPSVRTSQPGVPFQTSLARRSAGALVLALALIFALQPSAFAHTPPKVPKLSKQQLTALVDKYAAKYRIPRSIAHNLVEIESGWRQNARSYRGARGIMQLMPRTARGLRVNYRDPRQNIEGGMRYLRILYDQFRRWDLALAAYHSGPRNVIRFNGVPPKSKKYVARILRKPGTAASAKGQAASTAVGKASVAAKAPSPAAFERRQHVTVSGVTTTTVRESLRDGQVVWRAEETVTVQDGLRTTTTREFRMIDGVLTMVKEQTHVLGAAVDSNPADGQGENK